MAWLAVAKGVASSIFGGGKMSENIMDVAKGVGTWIDQGKLTKEEMQEYNQLNMKWQDKFMEQNIEQNSKRSEARRQLATLLIKAVLVFLAWAGAIYPFSKEYAAFILSLVVVLGSSKIVIAIVVFYFGYYGVQSIIGTAKKKKE
jgi:hypothetical protein